MNLSMKTLVYTIIISLVLMLFFTAYLVWLLPGLYVDHVNNQYVLQFEQSHFDYLEPQESSSDSGAMNNALHVVISKSDNELLVSSAFADVSLTITDEFLLDKINQLKDSYRFLEKPEDILYQDNALELFFNDEELRSLFKPALDALPFSVEVLRQTPFEEPEEDGLYIARQSARNTSLVAFRGSYESNDYLNLVAVTDREGDYVVSWASVVTGSIGQILPVTLQSLPMIALVVLGLVAFSSFLFSQRIVGPITQVSKQARTMMKSEYQPVPPLELATQDEISKLADDLDELYRKLQFQYHNLEQEHKRQEVFLRSGSHQLKTPLTASLLLVDGMIQQVGQYANVKKHLPTLRDRLQQMRSMVDSLLESHRMSSDVVKEALEVHTFTRNLLPTYRELADEKSVEIRLEGKLTLETNPNLFGNIMDSLLGNAISYAKPDTVVWIRLDEAITVENTPGVIDPAIMDHAMDPFVSSHLEAGRGMGLYTARMNAQLLDLDLSLTYSEQSVQVRLRPHTSSILSP